MLRLELGSMLRLELGWATQGWLAHAAANAFAFCFSPS